MYYIQYLQAQLIKLRKTADPVSYGHALMGFVNGDIVLANPAGIIRTLYTAAETIDSQKPAQALLVVGRRINLFSRTLQPTRPPELFQEYAQDYFFFNEPFLQAISPLPRSRLGGIAFDNWMTSRILQLEGQGGVDATQSIVALHPYTKPNARGSHNSTASIVNKFIHRKSGEYGR